MKSSKIDNSKESPLTNFQNSAIEVAEKELEELRSKIDNQKYLIDLSKADLEALNKFIVTDAPWKFTESLGVIEVEKQLKKAIKDNKLFTTAVAIEAIYYYLSKVEGKGKSTGSKAFDLPSDHSNVENYLRILKAITNGIEKIKVENEKIRNAEYILAARREGIEPEKGSEENITMLHDRAPSPLHVAQEVNS